MTAAPTGYCVPVTELLALLPTPAWLYDLEHGCNLCGNRLALDLFAVSDEAAFRAPQGHPLNGSSESWNSLNTELKASLQSGREVSLLVTRDRPSPGFLSSKALLNTAVTATFKPFTLHGSQLHLALVQVSRQQTMGADETWTDDPDGCLRLVDMCNNHPMFQFLFDADGKLLAGNKRAMQNMKEYLGDDHQDYTLLKYLSLGDFSAAVGEGEAKVAGELYRDAMKAIFVDAKPCHRFPQLRESKRHPGKYRWVLYEMWPQIDPITLHKAVLICEQNITQVKSLEEQFRKQNNRLQAQLEEALQQRDPVHKPAIDIDTPADKTLKLLDKIMRGLEVEAREAMQLRDSIVRSGDLRQPVNFNEQVINMGQNHSTLDLEVGESLIQLLSSRKSAKGERPATMDGSMSLSSISGRATPVMERMGQQGAQGQAEAGCSGQDTAAAAVAVARREAALSPADAESISLTRCLPDEVMAVLSTVDEWQFDAFQLNEASNGRPLSVLSYYLFKRFELIAKFQLDEDRLLRFLMRVEEGYPNNPYHNRIHAADVLQSLHVLLCRGNLLETGMVDDTALLACYLSAIIHDFEHRGVNNDYLVRVSDSLAILYNDRSPMENHHLAASFQLMHSDEYNFMPAMSPKVKESLRKLVIEMVLATDMKQHFAIHSMFQSKMQLNASAAPGPNSRPGSSSSQMSGSTSHRMLDDDVKTLSIQLALKCADLGHLSSPRVVHKKWVQYLEEEFFRQGDSEKKNQLAVSPLMDREKNGITKSQVGFFDIVALPLFQSFAQVFVETTPMLEAVKDNYTMWREGSALSSSSFSNSKSK